VPPRRPREPGAAPGSSVHPGVGRRPNSRHLRHPKPRVRHRRPPPPMLRVAQVERIQRPAPPLAQQRESKRRDSHCECAQANPDGPRRGRPATRGWRVERHLSWLVSRGCPAVRPSCHSASAAYGARAPAGSRRPVVLAVWVELVLPLPAPLELCPKALHQVSEPRRSTGRRPAPRSVSAGLALADDRPDVLPAVSRDPNK
jgi:hypothetical protein